MRPAEAPSGRENRGVRILRRLVTPVLIVVSLAGIAYAFTTSEDQTPATVRDAAVVRVFPTEGALHVRQDAVGVELAFGYTGVLQIDRTEIPEDQIDHVEGINRLSYTPAPDKEITALSPGRHCATALYWRQQDTREQSRMYTWCFTAA